MDRDGERLIMLESKFEATLWATRFIVILAVIFDNRTTLGLVRLKVKQASAQLEAIFKKIFQKLEKTYGKSIDEGFAEEAESELDNLFK